jgi:hypothetical protein
VRRALFVVGCVLACTTAGASAKHAAITFDDRARQTVIVTAPAYTVTFSKRNGELVGLVDRASGQRLVRDQHGCSWGVHEIGLPAPLGGCTFTPRDADRFSYRWNQGTATLTMKYAGGAHRIDAVVTLQAQASSLDLRVQVTNRSGSTLDSVDFPADLRAEASAIDAAYTPKFLPGVRLGRGVFSAPHDDVSTYPSRWAFADYLALDAGSARLALSAVNPAPAPIAPVDLGFLHSAAGGCAGRFVCIVHTFHTWIANGASWSSPIVRLRFGEPVERTILDYRHDNGIDAYPSLASKVGARLDTLARAPLVKADLWHSLYPFSFWPASLPQLPSPVLLHPVAFQKAGHDESYPDFLPPDPRWGTSADFRGVVDAAHALGQLVMPYLNVSWWDDQSPTLTHLPPPLTLAGVSVQDRSGAPAFESYSNRNGYRVSPAVPFVRDRVAALLEQWRTDVPADCVFFDQIGARPWQYDFNPAEPTPLAYEDSWLTALAPFADRCLMVEDGWDRLARTFAGFHGSVMSQESQFQTPDVYWGAGNWEPFPLAGWLFHDKVLMYQHDLYEPTFAYDDASVTFDIAYGLIPSVAWDGWEHRLTSPWLVVAGDLARALGPHYAGVPLASYRHLTPDVTETVFGDLTVTANVSKANGYDAGGSDVAPQGFSARTADGSVVAGSFSGRFGGSPLSAGTHYLIVQRDASSIIVRHPLGADTMVVVDAPASWSGRPLHVAAIDAAGAYLGDGSATLRDGHVELTYSASVNGTRVDGYRITAG